MSRIRLLKDAEIGPAPLVAAMRERRGGELISLDRLLLHSPPIAEGWNLLMGHVRSHLQIAPRWRELAICAVAALNRADYEWQHHAPPFLAAGGTPDQLAALPALLDALPATEPCALFDQAERAILRLSWESTRQVQVSEATFQAARRALGSERALFEMLTTIAAYNMVSRLLVAVQLSD